MVLFTIIEGSANTSLLIYCVALPKHRNVFPNVVNKMGHVSLF